MAHLREERKGNQQEFANVTNLVALPTHWLLHHTTTARHPRTTFPITHCIDITQLIALITHCTHHTADCTHHTADCTDHSLHSSHSWLHWSHTICKPWTSSLSLPSIVCHCQYLRAFSCWLPGPFTLIWPFAACLLTLPVFWYYLCLPPAPTFALSLFMSQPCLHYSYYRWPNFACLTLSCLIKLHLDLYVTDPSLQPSSKLPKLFNWNLKGTVHRKMKILSLFKEYRKTRIFHSGRCLSSKKYKKHIKYFWSHPIALFDIFKLSQVYK